MHFSDILTSLSGRPSICSVTSCGLTSHGYPLVGLLSCAWRHTVRSRVDGPRVPTSGYVKLLLPPRQSRGNSHFGLGFGRLRIRVDDEENERFNGVRASLFEKTYLLHDGEEILETRDG